MNVEIERIEFKKNREREREREIMFQIRTKKQQNINKTELMIV